MSATSAVPAGILVAVLAAGCASHDLPAPDTGPDAPPLRVSLEEPSYGTFSVEVNRLSYLMLFEVIPGRGVGLLYPTADWQERPHAAGLARVKPLRTGIRSYRETYRLESTGPLNQPTPDQFKTQRMVFVVASEVAPELGPEERPGPALVRLLKDETAERPYDAMERIITAIFPGVDRGRVATDVWVEEPAVARR